MMDINQMFREKNYEILKNKLDLDIKNNADSLNHTMSNFTDLKAISLCKYLVDLYGSLNVEYDDYHLKEMIDDESFKLKDLFLKNIVDRKEKIESFFEREVDINKISEDYITDYQEHIDSFTTSFNENIEVDIRDEVCTNFLNAIIKTYNLPDENSKEQLMEYINKSYCNSLIEKIESEVTLRNTTLKNLAKEAFERFKSMNQKTVE